MHKSPPRRYARNIPLLYAFGALTSFHLWLPIFVLYLQQTRGLTLANVGLMESLAWLGTAVVEVPTGAVADTYGRRFSLLIGGLSLGLVMIGYGLVSWYPLLLALHITWNLCQSFISGADQALLYDSLKADGQEGQFTRLSGRYAAIGSGAVAVSGLIGAWVGKFNLSLPFILTGILVIVAGLLALGFREPPREHAKRPSTRETFQAIGAAIGQFIQQRELRYLLLFAAVMQVPTFFYGFFLVQPYAVHHHLDVGWLGVLMLVLRGTGMLGFMLSHRLSARWGDSSPLYVLPGLTALILALVAFVPFVPGVLLLIVQTALMSSISPIISARLNRLIPSAQRATFLSVRTLLYTLFLAPLLYWFSKLADLRGIPIVFVCLAIFALVFGTGLLTLGAARPARSPAPATLPGD